MRRWGMAEKLSDSIRLRLYDLATKVRDSTNPKVLYGPINILALDICREVESALAAEQAARKAAGAERDRLRETLERIRDYEHVDMEGEYILATLRGWARAAIRAEKGDEDATKSTDL
jgi:hypothetical protein